jgi:hypothetical protein
VSEKLPLIGHDKLVIEKLAKQIWRDLPNGTMTTPLRDTLDRRGFAFDIEVRDSKGEPTGHIARVQVTLDRFVMASDADDQEAGGMR